MANRPVRVGGHTGKRFTFFPDPDGLPLELYERCRPGVRPMTQLRNLFDGLPAGTPDEAVDVLVPAGSVRVERIVSHGHASPPGFWYDQPQHEWVVLLAGAAAVQFEGDDHPVELRPGDCLDIPAHRKHRVEWTTPDGPTVWLAVHYAD